MKANPGDPRRVTRAPGIIAAVALGLFGVIAAAVTVIAVIESYSNLYAFALDHGLSGWRAAIAPAAVDSFIIMGELLLFAEILKAWDSVQAFAVGIGMAIWGFALSVGGNVWHAPAASVTDRLVAAIWPVTATAGLAGGLIIVRLVMDGPGASGRPAHADDDRQAAHGRPAGNPATVGPLTSDSPAGEAPPPVPLRREPRRVVSEQREAHYGSTGLAAASRELEQAVLAELLADPGRELPSWRKLSRDKFGTERSHPAKRVLDQARAARNGHGDQS